MRIRARFVIGACLIIGAVAYLIGAAIQNTSEYFMTVNELAAQHASLDGQSLRVAGRVQPGTIAWDPSGLILKFSIAQIPEAGNEDGADHGSLPVANHRADTAASDAPSSFRVVCIGQPKPDMFAAGRDVIVEGRLAKGGTIEATQVMTSCPSKYRPRKAR